MKIDGKIEGTLELSAFNAFFNLMLGEVGVNTVPRPILQEMATLVQTLKKTDATVLIPSATKQVYTLMQQAFDELRGLTAMAITQKGLTPGRLQLFAQTIADVKTAVDKNSGLSFRSFVSLPIVGQAGQKQWQALVSRFKFSPLPATFQGKLTFVKNNPTSKHLVIVFLDQHDQADVQKRIRDNILILAKKGLKLQGLEQVEEGKVEDYKSGVVKDPTYRSVVGYKAGPHAENQTSVVEGKRCVKDAPQYVDEFDKGKRLINAGNAVECLLGDQMASVGLATANRYTHFAHKKGSRAEYIRYNLELVEFGIEDGKAAVKILHQRMKETKNASGAMIYGHNHVLEVVQGLEDAGVNFAVFDMR